MDGTRIAALLVVCAAMSAGPASAQSALDEYARLRAVEIYDNRCFELRATDRIALAILISDASGRADDEAGFATDGGEGDDDIFEYFDHMDTMQFAAEALVPPACGAGATGFVQQVYTSAVRLNFALFLIASHRDALPEGDADHRPLPTLQREAMEAYLAIAQAVFGTARFPALQGEATTLAQAIIARRNAGLMTAETHEDWQEQARMAITHEKAIEAAGYRARALSYYGETKMVLLDGGNAMVALGLEWPRDYLSPDGTVHTGLLAVTPDQRVMLYLLEAGSRADPPTPHVFVQAEPLPPESLVDTAFEDGTWRRSTRQVGAQRMDDTQCVIGACYEIDPALLEGLDRSGLYEIVLASPSAAGDTGAANIANLRYLAIIATAIEQMLPRYE